MRIEFTEEIKNNFLHYLSLLVILILGVSAFFFFQFNAHYQVAVMVLTSFFYVLWGVIHHLLSGDLNLRVFLEYILVAAIAVLLVLSLIFRA